MMNGISLNANTLLGLEPMELIAELNSAVTFQTIGDIDTEQNKILAVDIMNKASAYICFFREMEIRARCQKREARKNDKDEASRLLGLEEIFEAYRKISEQHYEQIAKMMTMKRLAIDEYKIIGQTI